MARLCPRLVSDYIRVILFSSLAVFFILFSLSEFVDDADSNADHETNADDDSETNDDDKNNYNNRPALAPTLMEMTSKTQMSMPNPKLASKKMTTWCQSRLQDIFRRRIRYRRWQVTTPKTTTTTMMRMKFFS